MKVKKKIPKIKNQNQNKDVSQLHKEIKNSIKNLYISDQKKAKKIKEYPEILLKIRNEYALLQKEYNQTKIELQNYQHYVWNLPHKPHMNYQKPIRKRKHYYYDDQEESEESDSYVTEIRRRLSPTGDEKQEEEYDNKVQTKSNKRPLPPKQMKNQNNSNNTKSIKM